MNPRSLVAVGVAAVLLGGAFQGPMATALLVVAGLAMAAAGTTVLASAIAKRRDPYDLDNLRRVDERASMAGILDQTPVADADEVVCLRCGELNPAARPLCRRCESPLH